MTAVTVVWTRPPCWSHQRGPSARRAAEIIERHDRCPGRLDARDGKPALPAWLQIFCRTPIGLVSAIARCTNLRHLPRRDAARNDQSECPKPGKTRTRRLALDALRTRGCRRNTLPSSLFRPVPVASVEL